MPSSKLSGRRSTAKKPSICISIPPILIYLDTEIRVKIIWLSTNPSPTPINIDQEETCVQLYPENPEFLWASPYTNPNSLDEIYIVAPHIGAFNQISILARDSLNQPHWAYLEFQPPRPPPFSQEIEPISPDYPPPAMIIAYLSPVPK